MGCGSSSAHLKLKDKLASYQLSVAQKYLLRETWETVQLHKNTVGKQTFMK